MAETRRLREITRSALSRSSFPAAPVVVALSGGADSAALAYLANAAGCDVRSIHIDHGTTHAKKLRRAAQNVVSELRMSHEEVEVDVGEAFSEGRARDARYEALLERLDPHEWLVTGHTLDDQAETVLMNLLRGSGLAGLAGIPPTTPDRVARPLLELRRGELRELATLGNLPFVDDPANEDRRFTRNRIRYELIPLLESSFNPGVSMSLARLASAARSDTEFLDDLASRIPLVEEDGRREVAVSVLLTAPRALAIRALRGLLLELRPPHPPTSSELARVWDVVTGASSRVEIEGALVAVRKDGIIRVEESGHTPDH